LSCGFLFKAQGSFLEIGMQRLALLRPTVGSPVQISAHLLAHHQKGETSLGNIAKIVVQSSIHRYNNPWKRRRNGKTHWFVKGFL
jgi:hypothetical protein